MSTEEKAIIKVFKRIWKRKGTLYEEHKLELLLAWLRGNNMPPESPRGFDTGTWKEAGEKLFEVASKGDLNASQVLTTWCLLLDALRDLRAEKRTATATQTVCLKITMSRKL